MPATPTAQRYVKELEVHRSPEQREKHERQFKTGRGEYGEGDEFIGVRMGQVFALAREFIDMPPEEIEELLKSPVHEVRAGALSIMDKQGRRKKTPRPAGRSCSSCTCGARTALTTGTWWTSAPLT